uniref:Receptor protein serine/threonine kinase n=1 Tax=Opuntia streptacantha TaxID=393608 RepID=A0A7C9EKS0_OPUST
MITCSPDGTLAALGAPNEALSGKLSRAIANLTNLQTMLLQNNNISGEIPLEISSLSNQQTVDLFNNGFSGGVPSSLGHLKSLQYLRLNNNSLSGPIPASLANMSQLIFLDLSYNNLSGPMPRLPATTVNIMGNPLICGSEDAKWCSGQAIPVPVSSSVSSSPGKRCNILWLLWLGLIKVKSQLQLQWFY